MLTTPAMAACVALLAVPPLTDAQQAMLDATSTIKPSFEEPGLYALLENTAWWQPGDHSGATVPDYSAIRKNEREHRGELFLIEGIFPGTPQRQLPGMDKPQQTLRVPSTDRAGPWNDTLEQWPIIVDNGGGYKDVVLVYLTDPPPRPIKGDRIRTVGRFYKIWQNENLEGRSQDFLVFVGRSAVNESRSGYRPGAGGIDSKSIYTFIGILVLVLAAAFYFLRKAAANRPTPAQLRRQARENTRHRDDEPAPEEDAGPPLPEDPVKALDELQRRHDEAET